MGGLGSGSWMRWNAKSTTESQNRIDIRLLKKWGCLKGSPISIGACSWSRNGNETGSIGYWVHSHEYMVLSYRHRSRGGDWKPVEQRIKFDRTPCNYGGYRLWLLCPRCSRRVALIYGAGKYFLCRHCYRLTYASQQEGYPDRMLEKARKIRKRLDKDNGPMDLFPLKPKHMHWSTYLRLRSKAERAERLGWSAAGKWLGL